MQEGWKGRKVVRLRDSPFAHRKRKKSQHPLFLQIHRNGEEGVAGPTPERPFPPLSLFFLVSFFRLRLSRKLTFRPFSFLPSSSPPSYTFPDKGKFRNERRGEKIPLQRLAVSTVVFPRKKPLTNTRIMTLQQPDRRTQKHIIKRSRKNLSITEPNATPVDSIFL